MKMLIVVPCINLWDKYTKPALDSIQAAMVRAKEKGVDARILLIDNASTDKTKEEAEKMVGELFAYQRNEERWGFQKSVNYGVNRGFREGNDTVLVCNNDILIHPEALWRLAERFDKGNVGMVTCMDVRGETTPDAFPFMNPNEKLVVDEAPHPHFSAFAVNRECWDRVGEMDEVFAPAYFEDNDYHYRMKILGVAGVVYPPAMFYHFGSGTQNEADEKGQPIVPTPMFENNRAYYVKKWGGVPGQEQWLNPYNEPDKTARYVMQHGAKNGYSVETSA